VVFTDDPSAQPRFPQAGVSWVQLRGLRRRALLSFARRRVNRVAAHGLLLPAPFASGSWLAPVLYRAGNGLLGNLCPHALSMSVPYVTMVYALQHRSQPFMPEVSARGYWERWDQQYREHLGRATFVINGTRAGRDEIVRLYQVPRDRIVRLPIPT